jgi:hypothetical protein
MKNENFQFSKMSKYGYKERTKLTVKIQIKSNIVSISIFTGIPSLF